MVFKPKISLGTDSLSDENKEALQVLQRLYFFPASVDMYRVICEEVEKARETNPDLQCKQPFYATLEMDEVMKIVPLIDELNVSVIDTEQEIVSLVVTLVSEKGEKRKVVILPEDDLGRLGVEPVEKDSEKAIGPEIVGEKNMLFLSFLNRQHWMPLDERLSDASAEKLLCDGPFYSLRLEEKYSGKAGKLIENVRENLEHTQRSLRVLVLEEGSSEMLIFPEVDLRRLGIEPNRDVTPPRGGGGGRVA